MITLENLKSVLDLYYTTDKKKTEHTLTYRYKFTSKLDLLVNFKHKLHNLFTVDKQEKDKIKITVTIVKFNTGIARNEFFLKEEQVITQVEQLNPLLLLNSLENKYGFETGREIDRISKEYSSNNIFIGKNNVKSFLQCLINQSDSYTPTDVIHQLEYFSNTQDDKMIATIEYTKLSISTFFKYDLSIRLNYIQNNSYYSDYDPVYVRLNLHQLVEEVGIDNVSSYLILSKLPEAYDTIVEKEKESLLRRLKIDDIIKQL